MYAERIKNVLHGCMVNVFTMYEECMKNELQLMHLQCMKNVCRMYYTGVWLMY